RREAERKRPEAPRPRDRIPGTRDRIRGTRRIPERDLERARDPRANAPRGSRPRSRAPWKRGLDRGDAMDQGAARPPLLAERELVPFDLQLSGEDRRCGERASLENVLP